MKEIIKVAVMEVRACDVEPTAVTTDVDIPSSYGKVTTFFIPYYSHIPHEYENTAKTALSPLTRSKTVELIVISPGEPWVDITPFKKTFSREKSTEAVTLLSEALPQFTFEVADYPDEVQHLIDIEHYNVSRKHVSSGLSSIFSFFKRLLKTNL